MGEPARADARAVELDLSGDLFRRCRRTISTSASQHVWRSRDEGATWEKISPDLTRADPKTLGDTGGPIMFDEDGPEVYGTVFALAPSRLERNTIWAGSDDGVVHVTRDGGQILEAGDAARTAGRHAHQRHRVVAARARPRAARGEAESDGRSAAVPLSHRRLRWHLDAHRRVAPPPRVHARHPRRSRRGADCSTPAPNTASTSRIDDGAVLAVAAAEPARRPGARSESGAR